MTISFSDPSYLSKVQQIEEFSNYLISPLRKRYKVFHLSLTIVFTAIDKFLTVSKAQTDVSKTKLVQNLLKVKQRITTPIGYEVFSPTVSHSLPEKALPAATTHPLMKDTQPLTEYKPHLPPDQISHNNLLAWIPYPGILKLVRIARTMEKEFKNPPSLHNTTALRKSSAILTRNARALATSPAGPLTCSITFSVFYSGFRSPKRDIISPFFLEFMEGKLGDDKKVILRPVLQLVKTLVTNPHNWPQVPKHSISEIYTTDNIQFFTKVTEMYLCKKSSAEIDHFTDKSTLKKIAVKHQNLWCSKNRALSHESQLKRNQINPILRHSHSPLTISLAKHSHTLYDKAFVNRPSSSVHVGWKEDAFRFQKFGIILKGTQLFKQIQNSCLQCQRRTMKPIPVHMGLANKCIFSEFRVFRYIAVDLKGPFTMSTGRSLYSLVMVCIQTKITEIILLDSRTSTAILEAFNVAFSLYSTPSKITADKESGIIKIANNLPEINEALLEHHQVSIEFIPAKSHHFSGLVERRIKTIATILGTLDLSKSDMSETRLSNTLRIISNYLNNVPYLVQFVGNVDQGAASGNNEYPLELQFIAPVSWLNPMLENGFSPVYAESINLVQQSLLKKLDLVHKSYNEEIIPRLLLTLDRKRLKTSDPVTIGDMVLVHLDETRAKHSKAVLAQIVEAPQGRDLTQRVVTIRYFKANSCKMNGNKMIGKPIHITRGLETLSRINQSALEQCKVIEYLHNNCKAREHDPSVSSTRPTFTTVPNTLPLADLGDPHTPISSQMLDPDPNTIVWIREDTHHSHRTQERDKEPSNQEQLPQPELPTPELARTDNNLKQNNTQWQQEHPAEQVQQPQPRLRVDQQVTRAGRVVKKNHDGDYYYD